MVGRHRRYDILEWFNDNSTLADAQREHSPGFRIVNSAVVGLWHLGTVTAACLAAAGHDVVGINEDPGLIATFEHSTGLPVAEPGVEDVLNAGIRAGRLRFITDREAAATYDAIWRTYDTPVDENDAADVALNTRLLGEVIEAGPERVGAAFYEASLKQKQSGGTPLDRGAALCAYLASRESGGITGRLISAVWDPLERLHEVAEGLSETDIYTLRRIVPEDRGKAWN